MNRKSREKEELRRGQGVIVCRAYPHGSVRKGMEQWSADLYRGQGWNNLQYTCCRR
ncbi:unnamed protein product [Staurois parvus]|uniref:Uncharacterized protein n=1 Tax=Staurois parvus TaxID=386267 RepID=A0ABN9GJ38_9NEOB|nr:unnamed protein product [Staurois parvus]